MVKSEREMYYIFQALLAIIAKYGITIWEFGSLCCITHSGTLQVMGHPDCRSLLQTVGNVFSSMCQSFCPQGRLMSLPV